MQKTIKWGILGNAGIARSVMIPTIKETENNEVWAIASSSGSAQKTADEFGIPTVYNSYVELLEDTEIDAVYIPLPNSLHKEWVIKAANYKKHVLCEKPAAITSAEVEEMGQACRDNGVIFMEAFMYQFHPQHHRVKEIIQSGEIGELKAIDSVFSFVLDIEQENIRLKKETGGGSLFDVGCYCLHVSRLLTESEPESVYVSAELNEEGVDISAFGTLHFPGNVTATFRSSFQHFFQEQYTVIGKKGVIHVPVAFRPDNQGGVAKIIIKSDDGEREELVTGHQYIEQIEHFSNSILSGTEPAYSSDKTVLNMKTVEACLKSIERKEVVFL
ncbi:Gfo/Idh/MocA family protein [Bacillus alkalicellulosilyticus]|uniref:Gfo/Idh/MocA family protein n=1 Tax=Alkalihalobacterium alkalicellulosilyticum TaxID=1912214 RepID=UPI0009968DCC|nr:Gfo/Idh/MocA family oxidoreductase [Bacillus alkalicellulosilyticus]